MSSVSLTVCIPTYNRPEYLADCLSSVFSQSCSDFVVVVLDNASTVDYSGVLRTHQDPRLNYRRHPVNLGPAGNGAFALTADWRTPYLMIFHDDDLMHPRLIEWELEALMADQQAVLAASGMTFFRNGQTPPFERWDATSGRHDTLAGEAGLSRVLLRGAPLNMGSVMYRCDALGGITPDTDRFGIISDRPLLLDLARNGHVAFFNDPLVLYRVHEAQDSQTGMVTATHLIELYARYRAALRKDRAGEDCRLFYRVATNDLLVSYARLPVHERPRLADFVRECRRRLLFRFSSIRREGLAALCETWGARWLGEALRPRILLRRLGFRPRHWAGEIARRLSHLRRTRGCA